MSGRYTRLIMFEEDIRYINKLIALRQLGYNVIENVDYELIDDTDAYDIAVNTGSVGSNMNGN